MLVRLLYVSRAAVAISDDVVESILHQSRRNNTTQGITGLLCYSDELFIQILEGGRDEVCELYNAIVRDPRHSRVRLLLYDEIPERRFGGWTMGQVNIKKISPSLLLKYAERPTLNPFACSGRASMALLEELTAAGLVGSHG